MRLDELLVENNSNVAHSKAYQRGVEAGQHFLVTHGQHKGMYKPECEYEEGSEEHRAWHEGFKDTVHNSEWYGD